MFAKGKRALRQPVQFICLLCLLLMPVIAIAAPFKLSPLRMELTLPPEKTTLLSTLTVESLSSETLRLVVEPRLWSVKEDGSLYYNNLTEGANLLDKLKVNPKEFELLPGKTRLIRFAIKLTDDIPDGEYHLQLLVRPASASIQEAYEHMNLKTSHRLGLYLGYAYATTMYLYKGNLSPNVKVSQFQCQYVPGPEPLRVALVLENTGTRHARLKAKALLNPVNGSVTGEPLQALTLHNNKNLVVLPNIPLRKSEALSWDPKQVIPAPGKYQLELRLLDFHDIQPAVTATCDIAIP